jgi:predicted nucleotidyltransferase
VDPYASYVDAWRRRWAEQAEESRRSAAHAKEVAELLGRVLKERYGVRRVLLVGSLARGDFRLGSDIDLAVEGLADADLFSAGAELERRAELFEVDLVPLEGAHPAFRLAAEREGIELV